ncbi:MAG TPA: nucleotidyltransferase family protein [Candidatus Acidoferrales bacterium]|jgi:NDP-sugar pyrophosphorylase family protein|nr:nucleotidyltransferase family protein [Candidatus Acidoferrales bacterium]
MTQVPDVIILSGGFGLRLRGVIGEATPKPMAPINGRPFMELLLKQLKRHGFCRVILSVGHKHEVIREHFGDNAFGMELVYSVEKSPLGTGGALRQAVSDVNTGAVIVMNGDSYTDADLSSLIREHKENGADVTVVVIPETRSDAGSVVLDRGGKIKTFAEKRVVPESRYLSAGIYMLDKSLIATIPSAAKISIEEQLVPQWLADGKTIQASIFEGACIDIGTPERYQKAQHILEKVESESVLESEGRS